MIYLFYGKDSVMARKKARALVGILRKKKPDAELFKIDAEQFSAAQFEEFVYGAGLFERKHIVFSDNLFENKEARDFVLENIKSITSSENAFVFLEGDLDKKTLATFEKYAEKVQGFAGKEEKKKDEFNIFALGDALGARKKKELWILYRKALDTGLFGEEIHGTLFWMVKSMLLARVSTSAKEAGLNPFVYRKARGFAQNFTEEELREMLFRLVAIYHDAHGGGTELPVALELFILSI